MKVARRRETSDRPRARANRPRPLSRRPPPSNTLRRDCRADSARAAQCAHTPRTRAPPPRSAPLRAAHSHARFACGWMMAAPPAGRCHLQQPAPVSLPSARRLIQLMGERIRFFRVGKFREQFVEHPSAVGGMPSFAGDRYVEQQAMPLAEAVGMVQRQFQILLSLRPSARMAADVREQQIRLGKRRIDCHGRLEQFLCVGHPHIRRRRCLPNTAGTPRATSTRHSRRCAYPSSRRSPRRREFPPSADRRAQTHRCRAQSALRAPGRTQDLRLVRRCESPGLRGRCCRRQWPLHPLGARRLPLACDRATTSSPGCSARALRAGAAR